MDSLDRKTISFADKVNRRRFLRRSAEGVFATVAGWSLVGTGVAWGATDGSCPRAGYGTYDCNYPGGRACRSWSTTYCSGSSCAGSCTYWTTSNGGPYYTGCWCTNAYCTPGGRYGYWRCCDCTSCGNHTVPCGCRAFHEMYGCGGGTRSTSTASPGPEPRPDEIEPAGKR